MLTILRVRRLDRPSRKGGRGELASGLEVAGVGSSSRASSLLSGDAAGEIAPSSERDRDVPQLQPASRPRPPHPHLSGRRGRRPGGSCCGRRWVKPGGEKGQEGDDAKGAQGLTAAAAQEKRQRKGTRRPQLRGTAAPLLAPRAPAGCRWGTRRGQKATCDALRGQAG